MWATVKNSGFLGEKRKIGQNKIFEERMANNFSNFIKDTSPQFQKTQGEKKKTKQEKCK